jgi:hypothetical protein
MLTATGRPLAEIAAGPDGTREYVTSARIKDDREDACGNGFACVRFLQQSGLI